jgi:hypothetical protein
MTLDPYPPHRFTGSNDPRISTLLLQGFLPSVQALNGSWPNNSTSTLLSLFPRGDFNPRPSFKLFQASILPELDSCCKSWILRNPAHTPCGFHNNLWLFDNSNFALLATEVLQPLTLGWKILRLSSTCTHLA